MRYDGMFPSLLIRWVCACLPLAFTQLGVPALAASRSPLVILEFGYLDTSGEPRDQRAEHAARLKDMQAGLHARLEASGRFRVVALPDHPSQACEENTSCLLGEAREANAELVLTGTVHKISTMASQMWIGMFDVRTGERVFYRQMSFRGDTDEAWRRATDYLAREVSRSREAAAAQ